MRLIHYSENKIHQLEPIDYKETYTLRIGKPHGLWVSVEGEEDWKSWCEKEDYCVEKLRYAHLVTLKSDAKILHLKTPEEIVDFTEKYKRKIIPYNIDFYQISWGKVKKYYQGIIIAPYQWDCRLSSDTAWYYGWDCASGCIWDLSCIEQFKLIEQTNE
jgi:hypothetical protein